MKKHLALLGMGVVLLSSTTWADTKGSWFSRPNSMSNLSKVELQRRMGLLDAPQTDAEFIAPQPLKSMAPASLDWRNKDGVNWVSPILNQANCGSCVAFSTIATLETQVNITYGVPGLNQSFSPQALFACGGGACEFGWMPQLAAKHLMKTGVPDEACAPYTMGATGETVACSSICKDSAQRTLKILSYSAPTSNQKNIEAVKNALKKGPLMTTMMVYEDFVTYGGGIYKHTTGDSLGGHAISIVGYEDATRSWIIRNSWGQEWGEGGFAHISWDDISGISNSTWWLEVPKPEGYVAISNLKGKSYVTGKVKVEAESTLAGTSKVDISILDNNGRAILTQGCEGRGPCSTEVDTTSIGEGKFELIASATTPKGVVKSQHEQLFVVNSTPSIKLSFSAANGADLSQPLPERIVFDVQADSKPVILSKLVFKAKNIKTGEEIVRSTEGIVPRMTFGWRTILAQNGQYEIGFTGIIEVGGKTFSAESEKKIVTVSH